MATSPSIVSGRVVDTTTSVSKIQRRGSMYKIQDTPCPRTVPTRTVAFYGVRKAQHRSKLHLVFIARNRQHGPAGELLRVHLMMSSSDIISEAHSAL